MLKPGKTEDPMSLNLEAAPAKTALLRCVDSLGGVAFVRWTPVRGWSCVLENRAPASLFYAGVPHGEDRETARALDRADTVADVLRIFRARAQQAREVTLVH